MLLELNFSSKELKKSTQVNVLIPDSIKEGEMLKTVWLLHGLAGDFKSWMRYSAIERYANQHHLAVIMPDADRSWYANTAYGRNYFNYIAKELPELCRKTFKMLSGNREDQIVAGLSMGGYGAFKLALTYPEQYGYCISLSGSLDITRKGRPCDLNEWRSIFGFDLESPLALEGTEHDLFTLAQKNKKEGTVFPEIFMWCGTEDSLMAVNQQFEEHLLTLGVAHICKYSEGDHSWKWWDLHIQDALNWLEEKIQG